MSYFFYITEKLECLRPSHSLFYEASSSSVACHLNATWTETGIYQENVCRINGADGFPLDTPWPLKSSLVRNPDSTVSSDSDPLVQTEHDFIPMKPFFCEMSFQ